MKKLKYILTVILLLIITGCNISPKVQLEKAIVNMKNIKSTSVDVKADLSVPVLGSKLNLSADITGDVVNLNNKNNIKTHLNTTIDFLVKVNTESYSYNEDGYIHNYTNSNGKWNYKKTKIEDKKNSNISKEDIINMLETFKDVEKVDTDKEGYTKLLVTLNKDSLNELYNKYKKEDSKYKFNIENDVVATIYIKDGYIYIIDMDLSDIISVKNSTGHITISLTNINKVKDFDIPSEIRESEKE